MIVSALNVSIKNRIATNLLTHKKDHTMKVHATLYQKFFVSAFFMSIIILPGCSWFGSENKTNTQKEANGAAQNVPGVEYINDGSALVISMNGKPIVTQKSLEAEYQQLLQDNPQIEQMLPLMGGKEGLMDRLTAALADRSVLRRFIVEEGISAQAEYQAERERMIKSVTDMLNVKYFNKKYAVNVSNKDVREFYDKNKDTMPELLISRGGVQAAGVKFANEADAKAFIAKVKTAKNDLSAAAKEAGLENKVEDFQLVHNQSVGLSPILREKIVAIKNFPSVEVIKAADDAYWVVKATAKEDTVYREFEQVKENLKRFLEDSKREEIAGKAINDLKGKYNIKVEKTFGAGMPMMPGMMPMSEEDMEEVSGMPQAA
jgi:hypothetical protein